MQWERAASWRRLPIPVFILLWTCASGCNSLRLGQPGADKLAKPAKDSVAGQSPNAPGKMSFRVPPFVFLSDFEVKPEQAIFKELATLREQVSKELKLPLADTIVQIFLFENKEKYESFMKAKYPDLPKRRAFFVAQPRVGASEELLVYTSWGDRIQEDLRHECTHALLHSVLKDVPLWLDEGLAEYFEVPPDQNGINPRHLEQIRKSATPLKPDLARLEQLSQVQQMAPAEYRESWAWVHLMLQGKPEAKAVLLNYLQQLRQTSNPGNLGPHLRAVYPAINESLSAHLATLADLPSNQRAQAP